MVWASDLSTGRSHPRPHTHIHIKHTSHMHTYLIVHVFGLRQMWRQQANEHHLRVDMSIGDQPPTASSPKAFIRDECPIPRKSCTERGGTCNKTNMSAWTTY